MIAGTTKYATTPTAAESRANNRSRKMNPPNGTKSMADCKHAERCIVGFWLEGLLKPASPRVTLHQPKDQVPAKRVCKADKQFSRQQAANLRNWRSDGSLSGGLYPSCQRQAIRNELDHAGKSADREIDSAQDQQQVVDDVGDGDRITCNQAEAAKQQAEPSCCKGNQDHAKTEQQKVRPMEVQTKDDDGYTQPNDHRHDAVDNVYARAAEKCHEPICRRSEKNRQRSVLSLVGNRRDNPVNPCLRSQLKRVTESVVEGVRPPAREHTELNEEEYLGDRQEQLVADVAANRRPLEKGNVLEVGRACEYGHDHTPLLQASATSPETR